MRLDSVSTSIFFITPHFNLSLFCEFSQFLDNVMCPEALVISGDFNSHLSRCISASFHWDGKSLSSQWSHSRKLENRHCHSSTDKNLDLICSTKISIQSVIFHSFPRQWKRLHFNSFSPTVKKMPLFPNSSLASASITQQKLLDIKGDTSRPLGP